MYVLPNGGNGHCGPFAIADAVLSNVHRTHLAEGATEPIAGNLHACVEPCSPDGSSADVSRMLLSEMCHAIRACGVVNSTVTMDMVARSMGMLAKACEMGPRWSGWLDKALWMSTFSFPFVYTAYVRRWMISGRVGLPPRLIVLTLESEHAVHAQAPFLSLDTLEAGTGWCYMYQAKRNVLDDLTPSTLHGGTGPTFYRVRKIHSRADNAAPDGHGAVFGKRQTPLRLRSSDVVVLHHRDTHYERLLAMTGPAAGSEAGEEPADDRCARDWASAATAQWVANHGAENSRLFADAVHVCGSEAAADKYVQEHLSAEATVIQYLDEAKDSAGKNATPNDLVQGREVLYIEIDVSDSHDDDSEVRGPTHASPNTHAHARTPMPPPVCVRFTACAPCGCSALALPGNCTGTAGQSEPQETQT